MFYTAICTRVSLFFVKQVPFPKRGIVIAYPHQKVYNYHVLSQDMLNLEKEKKQMRGLTNYVLIPLTFIGALNWGLVGIFGFDFVAFLFGPGTLASNIVYAIIGIAALVWLIWMFIDRPVSRER